MSFMPVIGYYGTVTIGRDTFPVDGLMLWTYRQYRAELKRRIILERRRGKNKRSHRHDLD